MLVSFSCAGTAVNVAVAFVRRLSDLLPQQFTNKRYNYDIAQCMSSLHRTINMYSQHIIGSNALHACLYTV